MPSLIWVNQFALLPADGGGTRHFELSRELVRKGWHVTILASDFHLHARRYTRRRSAADRSAVLERQEGVDIRWLWSAQYERNDWRRAWNWLSFYRSVTRELRALETPIDVVIGSSPQIFAALAARSLARDAGAPFVFEVRDLWPESLLAAGGRRGPAYQLIELAARSLYRDAERVLVLARGTRDYLQAQRGVAPEKIGLIPNGVDVQSIRPADAVVGATDQDVTFIYAGAHGPANGLESVLDAAALIGPGQGIRFLLVGDGPAKAALMADAARRGLTHVHFHDPVSKPELARLLNASDGGLMILREAPLFSFGVSPNKLFDYLAAGLPVVCNVPGEVAQMLSEAGAGVQVADASGAALAAGIRVVAQLPAAERRAKGESGRHWVEREHSRQVLGDRLDGFLTGLLQCRLP